MPTDEKYGEQLGARLRDEVAQVRAAPDLVETLRRRRARRSRAVWVACLTPVVAAGAAMAVLAPAQTPLFGRGHDTDAAPVTGPSVPRVSGSKTSVAPPITVQPGQTLTVAYVTSQTINAVSRHQTYVIYSNEMYSTGYIETWTDKVTQRYRNLVWSGLPAGVPVPSNGGAPAPPGSVPVGPPQRTQGHEGIGPIGNRTTITVDYQGSWWSKEVDTSTYPPSADPPPDMTDPDSIQSAIKNGRVELLGLETVDGQRALHLRFFAEQRGYRLDMWVDATTYLPVREDDSVITSDRDGPEDPVLITTFSWLPRTAENLALLDLTPPPGFRYVP
jgi:hypothetical protein